MGPVAAAAVAGVDRRATGPAGRGPRGADGGHARPLPARRTARARRARGHRPTLRRCGGSRVRLAPGAREPAARRHRPVPAASARRAHQLGLAGRRYRPHPPAVPACAGDRRKTRRPGAVGGAPAVGRHPERHPAEQPRLAASAREGARHSIRKQPGRRHDGEGGPGLDRSARRHRRRRRGREGGARSRLGRSGVGWCAARRPRRRAIPGSQGVFAPARLCPRAASARRLAPGDGGRPSGCDDDGEHPAQRHPQRTRARGGPAGGGGQDLRRDRRDDLHLAAHSGAPHRPHPPPTRREFPLRGHLETASADRARHACSPSVRRAPRRPGGPP